MGTGKRQYTELGHRLTEIMGSQERIAKVLGIQRAAVSKKLLGNLNITVADLEKIAAHLHVPMTVFFEKRGTDGGVLDAFHKMHMHSPDSLDRIINAFYHNRQTLRRLAEVADELVKETAPEIRRREHLLSAGVVNSGVVLPTPSGMKEETDESEDDNQEHHGVDPDS